jgi:hypothetical protein
MLMLVFWKKADLSRNLKYYDSDYFAMEKFIDSKSLTDFSFTKNNLLQTRYVVRRL